jgi:hypothetical protein
VPRRGGAVRWRRGVTFRRVTEANEPQVLRLLQATRYCPPGLAASDRKRRARYGAALEQFEELMSAARICGAASRPLSLFYALCQGGQAIAAAHLQTQGGQLQGGHGLTVPAYAPRLGQILVAPQGVGSFQLVAQATGSDEITAATAVGALWASLPEGAGDPLGGSTHPPALALYPEEKPGPSAFLKLTDKAVALIFGLPEAFGIAQDRVKYLRNYLNQYSTADGWESSTVQSVPAFQDPAAGWATRLQWRLPQASGSAAERSEYLLTTVAPRYDTFSCGWIRPALGPKRDSPSALMTWWAVLYALSMLARYYPDKWVKILDLDHCADAVPVRAILDDALTAVPRLVLSALQQRPYLTTR